jgi:exonuclease III
MRHFYNKIRKNLLIICPILNLQGFKGIKGEYAGKYNLYSIAETITQDQRYSDWYDSDNNCNSESNKDFSMIDHILVTDFIRKNIYNTFMYHEYKEYCGKYDSDHFPGVIDLIF